MKVKLFMENMWEFFLVFYFVPCREIFLCYFFVPCKVNIPMYAWGDLNKSYIRNIFVGYK